MHILRLPIPKQILVVALTISMTGLLPSFAAAASVQGSVRAEGLPKGSAVRATKVVDAGAPPETLFTTIRADGTYEFLEITDDPFTNHRVEINDWGEMVWRKGSPDEDAIRTMRRIRTGEADFDGNIDLKDAAAFQNCYTGPGDFDGTTGGFDRLCDCRFLDIDHDRDVDADDYALFATAMTGPE